VIEKHITIDREKQTEDYESSLNGPEFAVMVEQLRQVWQSLGEAEHELTAAELAYRKRFKKSIVAKCRIARGRTITADQIAFKIGPESGMATDQASRVIGKSAVSDITPDTLIHERMLR
jgi:sialic acid synthase SpsE